MDAAGSLRDAEEVAAMFTSATDEEHGSVTIFDQGCVFYFDQINSQGFDLCLGSITKRLEKERK